MIMGRIKRNVDTCTDPRFDGNTCCNDGTSAADDEGVNELRKMCYKEVTKKEEDGNKWF